jgi:hypothetical protein
LVIILGSCSYAPNEIGTPSLDKLITKLSNEIVSNFKNSMDIIGEKMNQKG